MSIKVIAGLPNGVVQQLLKCMKTNLFELQLRDRLGSWSFPFTKIIGSPWEGAYATLEMKRSGGSGSGVLLREASVPGIDSVREPELPSLGCSTRSLLTFRLIVDDKAAKGQMMVYHEVLTILEKNIYLLTLQYHHWLGFIVSEFVCSEV